MSTRILEKHIHIFIFLTVSCILFKFNFRFISKTYVPLFPCLYSHKTWTAFHSYKQNVQSDLASVSFCLDTYLLVFLKSSLTGKHCCINSKEKYSISQRTSNVEMSILIYTFWSNIHTQTKIIIVHSPLTGAQVAGCLECRLTESLLIFVQHLPMSLGAGYLGVSCNLLL